MLKTLPTAGLPYPCTTEEWVNDVHTYVVQLMILKLDCCKELRLSDTPRKNGPCHGDILMLQYKMVRCNICCVLWHTAH